MTCSFTCKRLTQSLECSAGRRPRVLDYVGGASNSSAAFLDDTMYWAPGVLRTWEEANEVCRTCSNMSTGGPTVDCLQVCKQAGGWLLEARNSDINDLAMRLCLSVRSASKCCLITEYPVASCAPNS